MPPVRILSNRRDEESSKLFTFNTPFEIKITRLPFGMKSGPEEFQRYMPQMTKGLPGTAQINGVESIIDHILVWKARTMEEHDGRVKSP